METDFRSVAMRGISVPDRAEALKVAADCRVQPDDPSWLLIASYYRGRPEHVAAAVAENLRAHWSTIGGAVQRDIVERLGRAVLWGSPRFQIALVITCALTLLATHIAAAVIWQRARVGSLDSEIQELTERRDKLRQEVRPSWVDWIAYPDREVLIIQKPASLWQCTWMGRDAVCASTK